MSASPTPLFSIAIPTYNRATGYLKQALESAVAQGYSDLEILVSDNCSTDATESVVRGFADPRIRYVKHPVNLGPASNFKYCIEAARGNYWLMLHDDDLIDADFVATCMAACAGRLDYGMIRTGVRLIDGNGAVIEQHPNVSRSDSVDEFILDWFSGRAPLYLCNTVFHRENLLDVGGFVSKKNLYNDVVAEVRIAARSPILNIQDVKASFRRHEENHGVSMRVRDWTDESAFLLDEIISVGADKTRLREAGQQYFCRKLYKRAEAIPQLWDRWRCYRLISDAFGNCYSPYERLWDRTRSRVGRWRRRVLSV